MHFTVLLFIDKRYAISAGFTNFEKNQKPSLGKKLKFLHATDSISALSTGESRWL